MYNPSIDPVSEEEKKRRENKREQFSGGVQTGELGMPSASFNRNPLNAQEPPAGTGSQDTFAEGNLGSGETSTFKPVENAVDVDENGTTIDDEAENALLELIREGPGDTAEEEAFIREQTEQQAARDLNDQRAAAGRAGFASSGALQAMESDTMRDAQQRALQEIFGLRDREEQQYLDKVLGVIGGHTNLQESESELEVDQARIDAINELIGTQGDDNEDGIPDNLDEDDQARADFRDTHETVITNYADMDPARRAPGGQSNPYLTTSGELDNLKANGLILTPVNGPGFAGDQLYKDQDGKYWFVRGGT